ncbi:hypothetical protein QP868_11260 [Brevibacterium sp. UMB1308A]|uniref:hypothetical protein n=1 Tax=Brevibacterium sp. UMB1308A TaxID=3050608 RepID=UPI00254AA105|nr:hypothetical protein [Brevibacterium sp. UMB1308A]MDK8347152.1 hypothetical protein [Brevibacterium sp. UMB1308B]MDK8714473.1 hypothetical protein [Brevibacterium sp. UMB1308A]
MRITALGATALAVAALGGAPALAAIPQSPASVPGPASTAEPVPSPASSPVTRADASPTAEPTSDPAPESEPTSAPTDAPTADPTDNPGDTDPSDSTSETDVTPTDAPTPDRRTSPNTESTPEPSDEPSPAPSPDPTSEPTPKSTEDPGKTVKPSTVKSHGEWYEVMVDGKRAPEGSTFSAVERNPDGTETKHDFIIGKNGQVFHFDTSKLQNKGEAVDPSEVTLKVENGSVEFINEPTPTPSVSPTPPPDNQTPPDDDDTQQPPRPNPPATKPPVQDPPEEDGRQPGERPGKQPGERPGNQDEGDTDNGSNGQEKSKDEDGNNSGAKDRTQDPDTGNGTVPGQAGADWTPGNSGDEETREPDYSDPVPQNPDDAGEVSQDIIAGPEPSHEDHAGAPTASSSDGEDTAADAAEADGSFPWSLAVLLGTGVVGLLLAVFLFARRKSED